MEGQGKPQIFSAAQQKVWHQAAPSIWTLDGGHLNTDPALSIARTLLDQPRWLEPYHLYDERGSQLFEKICELPEYYSTRTEDSILEREAGRAISLAQVECILELGAGFAKKTMHLVGEQVRQRQRGTFAPVDVSLTGLAASRNAIKDQFPQLVFHGIQALFDEGIAGIKKSLPTLFVFLGSTVGNFTRSDLVRFFQHLSESMGPHDFLLLGVDRVKDVEILERAYNDAQGVTADFILNAFLNINRLIKSNFDLNKMSYHSWYNPTWQQVEMYAVSTCTQEIYLPSHATSFTWEKGDRILVEVSRKFEPEQLQKQLHFFGLRLMEHFTDPKEWFSLLLFRKSDVALT
ncbi:MAG: L-histidine N(alpha)-methyltransferase [Candidatus Binatia bacterium]